MCCPVSKSHVSESLHDVGMVQLQHRSYGSIALYALFLDFTELSFAVNCAHEN